MKNFGGDRADAGNVSIRMSASRCVRSSSLFETFTVLDTVIGGAHEAVRGKSSRSATVFYALPEMSEVIICYKVADLEVKYGEMYSLFR